MTEDRTELSEHNCLMCHGCGFTCRQSVIKTFYGPSYRHFMDLIVSLWHFLVNLVLYEYVKKV